MSKLTHSDEHGGLMAKSIGAHYPYAVSGLGCGLWYVWHTLTGHASCTLYVDIKEAYTYLEACEGGPFVVGSSTIEELLDNHPIATVQLKTGEPRVRVNAWLIENGWAG